MGKPSRGTILGFVFIFYNTMICLLLLRNGFSSIIGSTKIDDIKVNSKQVNTCLGRYIFIHDLPKQFNEDVLENCHLITRKTDKYDTCMYTLNSGFGPRIENSNGVLSNTTSWFSTNLFFLEVIFHNRMKNYECLTNDSSLASAIYVPFYAGLNLRRHLWGFKPSVRDSSGKSLIKWLSGKPEWEKMRGLDHFLVSGRPSFDFRRQSIGKWGSMFRFLPESRNMTMLSVDSGSWSNDVAIPYPTYFHPSEQTEVSEWQERMRRQKREYLFCFVGAPRNYGYGGSIRGSIIGQCKDSSSCQLLDCSDKTTNCYDPVTVMKAFESSVFCLQPPGDVPTRRSAFDSILAGCIPVFFHPGSAYTQYKWHLPKNHTKYSVFIPEKKLRDRRFRINETLLGVSKVEEEAMREEVIRLIPRTMYGDHKSKLEDAFDLAVKGVLERVEKLSGPINL